MSRGFCFALFNVGLDRVRVLVPNENCKDEEKGEHEQHK